jgi:hypothetical protein
MKPIAMTAMFYFQEFLITRFLYEKRVPVMSCAAADSLRRMDYRNKARRR